MKAGRGEVTVYAPGLLGPWPAALAEEIGRGLDLPGLGGLLACARRIRRRAGGGALLSGGAARAARLGRPRASREVTADPPERLAFGLFDYRPRGAEVPAAALTWERDSADSRTARPPPGSGAGSVPLRADPVHLRADLDAARLFDASSFALAPEEAAALADALDRHFAGEGLRFAAPHPTRWYVLLDRPPDAVFLPPGGAAARGAGGSLPAGNEGSGWRRRMNEAQMVLHGHRVNEAREARGELPINSVWFWGAGAPGPPPPLRFGEVWTGDPLVRALAERGGARVRGLDGTGAGETGPASGPPAHRLIALDPGFQRAVAGRDVEAWRRGLREAEERWFGPLLEALRAGRLRKVTVRAGLQVGEAVFAAAGRRARRPPAADAAAAGLSAFLLTDDP